MNGKIARTFGSVAVPTSDGLLKFAAQGPCSCAAVFRFLVWSSVTYGMAMKCHDFRLFAVGDQLSFHSNEHLKRIRSGGSD